MNYKMSVNWMIFIVNCVLIQININFASTQVDNEGRLLVAMTLVPNYRSLGAFCLDGSPPGYHLHRGVGDGDKNWLLQFEGGGWCVDIDSCFERSLTRRGSTRYMNKLAVFSGILSNDSKMNPDFYNWNRVKLRYCDGASFTGDSQFQNGSTTLYFRGQRIWNAIIQYLLPQGLFQADKVLLSGCSAGGLATFHHCDNLANLLRKNATLKCMSDAGFFLDVSDVSGNYRGRDDFNSTATLQNVQKNLNKNCTTSRSNPNQCFFPQYTLPYIKTPYFILNSAYDVYQFHHIFVPPTADPNGHWKHCTMNPAQCTLSQINTLQGYRNEMLAALHSFRELRSSGLFINSCFAHCQSELQDTWFAFNSPRVNNKSIAVVVGDWYFEREVAKEVDCPYPCDSTCHNLIPEL